jgi:nitrate reductase NapE
LGEVNDLSAPTGIVANLHSGVRQVVEESEKKAELFAFIMLVVFLAPFLSVAIVGGYGFIIWISQVIILGPPGA